MKGVRSISLIIITTLLAFQSFSQNDSKAEVEDWYFGNRYKLEANAVSGNPNLNGMRVFSGNVLFNHQMYNDQPLFYDLEKNALVLLIEPEEGVAEYIELSKSNVKWFELIESKERFISIDQTKSISTGLSEGFYQLVYSNELTLLKEFKKEIVLEEGSLTYKQFDDILMSLGDFRDFVSVKSKSKFLKKFSAEIKPLVKKYIQDGDTKYEDMTNLEFVELMMYVESLSPNQSEL